MDKGDVDSKIIAALLTGVNRAFPFTQLDDEVYDKQTNALFRVVHVTSFNTSVQALMLLLHVMDRRQTVSDRFYRYGACLSSLTLAGTYPVALCTYYSIALSSLAQYSV